MATAFQTDGGGLWADQQAGSELDYTLDWSETVGAGDSIVASDWTAEAGVLLSDKSYTDATTTAWVSGGIAARSYGVTNTITTASGRRDSRTFRISILDGRAVGAGRRSVFPSIPEAILSMRRDRLFGPAQAWMAGIEMTDEYLLDKLLSAERAVERSLRVFLSPVEVLPGGASAAERQALDDAGARWVEEPGYDHEGGSVWGGNWGLIELRHRPVVVVHEIRFAYPDPSSTLFTVPREWIRLERKYGRLQLVPVQSVGGYMLSSLTLSALSAGQSVPLAIQVRYRAGLENAARDHPDILGLVKRWAVLDVLEDQFLASSGSTSVDGLSQSLTWDAGAHRAAIEKKLDAMRSSIHGVRFTMF